MLTSASHLLHDSHLVATSHQACLECRQHRLGHAYVSMLRLVGGLVREPKLSMTHMGIDIIDLAQRVRVITCSLCV